MTLLRCVGLLLAGVLAWSSVGPVARAAEAKAQVQSVDKAAAKKPPAAKAKPVTATRKPVKVTKTPARKKADTIAAPLPKARLDLSLPPDLMKGMKPVEEIEAEVRKPLLPAMFGEKPDSQSPFQLNGRLLSNEMQLQLRNEMRQQEIEGAAIDFEFKQ